MICLHTGPALSPDRSAPSPTALSPAPITSGNPHTLTGCLIFFYLLLIYHLLQASPPACWIHFLPETHTAEHELGESVNVCFFWSHTKQTLSLNACVPNLGSKNLISSTEATEVLAVNVRETKQSANFLRKNYY